MTTAVATPHRAPTAALKAWTRALTDPAFSDLPFKVETTATGQYILTPPRPAHSDFQFAIPSLLRDLAPTSNLPPGKPAVEVAVETTDGVKAVDVAWVSDDIRGRLPGDAPAYAEMPELTIEIRSPSNSAAELRKKKDLYLEGGALEAWIREEDGRMRFYGPQGSMERSALVPDFPPSL